MFTITQKRIVNIAAHLAPLEKGTRFRVVVPLSEVRALHLEKIGFTDLSSGARILPFPCGPVSRFNADGKWILFKNMAKESRFIRTVLWEWQDWSGEKYSDQRDIYKDCYVRELSPPPSVELTISEQAGVKYITSDILSNDDVHHELIKHIMNLFLEFFGFCQLKQENLDAFDNIKVLRYNWEFLPAGEYPWEKLEKHIQASTSIASSKQKELILERQRFLHSFEPDTVCVGRGGFREYLAYIFSSKKMVFLESLKRDNAIYVFDENWESLSKLTKADIINGKHCLARIIHSKGWQEKVESLFLTSMEKSDVLESV